MSSKTSIRSLLIIPAFNEERSLPGVLTDVRRTLPSMEILVIDDGSSDNTTRVAREAGATVVRHPFNLGYGAAIQTGYKYADRKGFDAVLQMDADGQHDPASLPALLDCLQRGEADVAIGSRFLQDSGYDMGPARSAGRLFFQRVLLFFGGPTITDPTSGLQALSRRAFSFCCSDFYPADFPDIDVLLLIHRAGFRIVEVPVAMRASPPGRETMHAGMQAFYYPYKMLLATFRNWRRTVPVRSAD